MRVGSGMLDAGTGAIVGRGVGVAGTGVGVAAVWAWANGPFDPDSSPKHNATKTMTPITGANISL